MQKIGGFGHQCVSPCVQSIRVKLDPITEGSMAALHCKEPNAHLLSADVGRPRTWGQKFDFLALLRTCVTKLYEAGVLLWPPVTMMYRLSRRVDS